MITQVYLVELKQTGWQYSEAERRASILEGETTRG